ncbi:SDR family oxidoreductase [Paracoccaceae bacterium]
MRKAVVLGGYGLIGSACCAALLARRYEVTAVGRTPAAARGDPRLRWEMRDIAVTTTAEWRQILSGADVVVNASGALQDGARDSLAAIHDQALGRLVAALAGSKTRFIQISAVGVAPYAATEFLRSKARGEARLIASPLDWVILRPALVIGPEAYGGTALLRAAAAVPGVFLRIYPEAPVQTVWLGDVAEAVALAAGGHVAPGTIADLTEPESQSFAGLVERFRSWLGLAPWRLRLTMPPPLVTTLGRMADGLGWLGWRAPLRSTALISLRDGIRGDPAPWAAAGGPPCRGLDETLALMPATQQEIWFARLYLLLPLAIAVLSLFWALSGLLALLQPRAASGVLTARGVAEGPALAIVFAGGLADLALGLGLLLRRWTVRAALAMVVVASGYLAGSLWLAPDLWLDPLGPMLKVLPTLPLALMVAALVPPR